MAYPVTGVILSGGRNKRFSGKNKAFIEVEGQRMLDRIYQTFHRIFEQTILITNDPLSYLEWDAAIVTDRFPVRSALTGIHTGLFYASRPFVFFTACDMPWVKQEVIETILDEIEDHIDVVLPETGSGIEPLCAVYSRRCLKPIEYYLAGNRFKIKGILKKFRVKTISEGRLKAIDPQLTSFININSPDDLAAVKPTGGSADPRSDHAWEENRL